MRFWQAMREMQENGAKVRCKSWEKQSEWHLGDDIELPTRCDWEDVMDEWEIFNPKQLHRCEKHESGYLCLLSPYSCYEDGNGGLFIQIGKSISKVKYCPICGYKSEKEG